MAFLTENELKTLQHAEIITAITRADDTIVPMMIDESIAYMKGYLNARFDVAAEFAKEGGERNIVLLKILKAMVIYEIYSLANPAKMTEVVKENNARAMKWLTEVQKGNVNPDLDIPDPDDDTQYIKWGGNKKKENHY